MNLRADDRKTFSSWVRVALNGMYAAASLHTLDAFFQKQEVEGGSFESG